MPKIAGRCFCCGRRYYADNDEGCPDRNITPHSDEIVEGVIHYLVNMGWDFTKPIPKDLHKEALYEVLFNGYRQKSQIEIPTNVKEFLKIVEQT